MNLLMLDILQGFSTTQEGISSVVAMATWQYFGGSCSQLHLGWCAYQLLFYAWPLVHAAAAVLPLKS